MSSYPSYQTSETQWLGNVPSHWSIVKTGRVFTRKKETNEGMKCESRLALTMRGVVPRNLDDVDGLQSTSYDGYQIFEKGDIAFKLIDLENVKTSRVGHVGERGIMSPAYIRLEPTLESLSRFGYWYFTALYWQRVFNNLGGGIRQALGPAELCDIPFPLPPRDEQIAIAGFLDHETGKIDGLIAEQEHLIALLDEKRQAVISHAVTKGLDPDVEMKDSGIEWLGEVPAHWEITRIREAASLMNGYPFDSNKFSQDAGHPLVRIRDLDCKQTALLYDGDFIDAAKVDGNDLLIGMDGDFNVGRWRGQGEALLNQRVCCLRGDAAIIRWLEYVIPYPLKLINDVTYSTTVKHLSSGQVLGIRIPLPRGNEMGALLDHLDKAVGLLDNLSKTAKEGILLLKERRSALISAAVTGKIDVRNHPAAVAALNENKD